MPAPAIVNRPNPTGILAPHEVLGRGGLLDHYWEQLDQGSLVLTGLRRIGKSSICLRMAEVPRDGFVVCKRDVEDCDVPERFVANLRQDADAALRRGFDKYLAQLSEQGKRIKIDYKRIALVGDAEAWPIALGRLLDAVDRLGRQIQGRVVLIWDELSMFLDRLMTAGRAADAGVLLDVLRAHRQQVAGSVVRMVYTGSIGMLELVDRLRRGSYRGAPLSDMRVEVVPQLDHQGACELARSLL